MNEQEIVAAAIGAVNNVRGTATEEEIASAVAEIEAQSDHEDRSGE